jgi:hypothetical protein
MASKTHNFAQKHHHFAHYPCGINLNIVGINYVEGSESYFAD